MDIPRLELRQLVSEIVRETLQHNSLPQYLTARQVAELTNYSTKTLERLRASGTGPRWFRVGDTGSVRYRASDVRGWIEQGGAS